MSRVRPTFVVQPMLSGGIQIATGCEGTGSTLSHPLVRTNRCSRRATTSETVISTEAPRARAWIPSSAGRA